MRDARFCINAEIPILLVSEIRYFYNFFYLMKDRFAIEIAKYTFSIVIFAIL